MPPSQPPRLRRRFSVEDTATALDAQIESGSGIRSQLNAPFVANLDKVETDARMWFDYNYELLRRRFTTDEVADEYHNSRPHYMRSVYDNPNRRYVQLQDSLDRQLTKLRSIRQRLQLYEIEEDQAPQVTEVATPRYRDVHIHIEGSTVGQLNLGHVVGNIETHLSAVSGPSADELRTVVTELVQAIVADEKLTAAIKADALDNIDFLTEAAATPSGARRLSVVRAVLYWMGWALGAGGSGVLVWGAAEPVLHRFFGI